MDTRQVAVSYSVFCFNDSGIYVYDGQNQPVDFASPSEGVMALEQVLNVTPGSKVKELAFAYIDYMLRPDVQKKLAEAVWYSPANKTVKLDPRCDPREGRAADPGGLEVVQRPQGRDRRPRGPHHA